MGKLIYHLCAVKISKERILLLEGSGRTASDDLDIQLHIWNAALLDILYYSHLF